MKFEMVMPKMGESITEGTILKWLKSVGDQVTKDETILEISTDKVDSEIPAPVTGKLSKLLAEEGETVEVGVPIAEIETDAAIKIQKEKAGKEEQPESPDTSKTNTVQKSTAKPLNTNRFYSPVVLNIAKEHGISNDDLEQIPGSGINGRVTKKDIKNFISNKSYPAARKTIPRGPEISSAKGMIETIPMDNMRKSIAEHMIHSKQTSAHVSLYSEVDFSNVYKIREGNKNSFKAREGFSLTYMPFIVETVVKALKEFPMLNAALDGDKILIKKFYNIGIAVAVENGLLVPNIFNCDEKNLIGLARAIDDIAMRARTKKINHDELANGTFSISNFGVFGTTIGFPIINQPQVAILGVGALKKRAVVIDDAIAIRPIVYLSLTIDHRLIDGAMGAQFLQRIGSLLEDYDPQLIV